MASVIYQRLNAVTYDLRRICSSLSVPKVPDALLSTEPTRERIDCIDCMVDFVRPARESKSKSMEGRMVVG
jgi:hypothetical protein